jgi:tRNA threonylcarbamoyladenosine biosynthesis protein TsaE
LKITNSTDDTKAFGKQLALDLLKKPRNLFLFGELGAGKTTLLKGLGEGLGIKEDIISPTFQLIRTYQGKGGIKLSHIDLYRLSDLNEILHLGWWDIIDEDSITAVEWADRAKEILPEEAIFLRIRSISKTEREIEIHENLKDVSWD